MKRIIFIVLLFNLANFSYSQGDQSYLKIVKAESELKTLFDELYSEEIFGLNLKLYAKIDSLFNAALHLPGAYDYAWNKLDKIGKLTSDDRNLKVFSWLYMENRNLYHYTSYMLIQNNKDEFDIIKLIPGDSRDIKTEGYPQSVTDWHGKIYYELITTEFKRKVFYTLIGADFNNTESAIKTIEVVTIQRGKPVFRGDQFLDGGKVKDRLIFEYSASLACSVRYNEQLKMIVFDHLVPLHPLYSGNYQFYGPDGSYDGLLFKEGIWVKTEDVDARNF